MKTTLAAILVVVAFALQSQAEVVLGGDFSLTKPGEPTISAIASAYVPWNPPNPPLGLTVGAGGTATYGDGTTGTTVDLLGWKKIQGNVDMLPNSGVDGGPGGNFFAAWGGDSRIESDPALGTVKAGTIYTISAQVNGGAGSPIDGPLAFHLMAGGVQLTPTSTSPDPVGGNGWQTLSRTYDAATMAPHIGAELTIVVGVEDANDNGGPMTYDDISLDAIGPTGFTLTAIAPDADPTKLSVVWESQAGKLYDLVATTDPSAEPQVWTPLASDVAATPPSNTEVFTKPVDPFTAFAVLEKPVPPLFEDDFETDKGWSVGVDGGTDTDWERGIPSVIGPPAANSPVNCYGTNIDAAYGLGVNIYLRSPAIDLSGAVGATLTFQHFYDIESTFDMGAVRVLRAGDLTPLGADVLNPVDGTVTEWTQFTGALPAEALGENVILEFRFTSDGVAPLAQAGWYIDDVSITVE